MFDIFTIPDIKQLVCKRQLRNNMSVLYLIKGVDKYDESLDLLKMYSSKCTEIFYDRIIEKPTFEETNEISSIVMSCFNYDSNSLYQVIKRYMRGLDDSSCKILSQSLSLVLNECHQNGINNSMIKNAYIRCLVTLAKRLSKVTFNLSDDNRILYIGKPDKFDILTFTVLGLCGVDIVIVDFDKNMTSECLCQNRFVVIDGVIKDVDLSFISYINQGISDLNKNISNANEWVDFKDYSDLDNILKLLNFKVDSRKENNLWKVLHLEVQGVPEINMYSQLLDSFVLNITASNRKYVLFDNDIPKLTFDETNNYRSLYVGKSFVEILLNYELFKDSGIGVQIDTYFNELLKNKYFQNDRQKDNYDLMMKMWVAKYLDMFFTFRELNKLPLIIVFGELSEKEMDLINLLSFLPIDIVSFKPNYKVAYSIDGFRNTFKPLVIGEKDFNLKQYPKNAGVNKVSTIAYNAEQELDSVLYSDTSIYKVRQFKNNNPIVLKTTYEEINILWNEPAKFRPSFASVGELVTVPTIFAKINGVDENYMENISKLIQSNKNTIYFDSFPIQLQQINNNISLREFAKQLVFKDQIDFERLKKSPYYTYSVYSEETQHLILDKVDKLISMKWCANGDNKLVYEIIDTIFRLPPNIMQLIHNFDFTAEIPKIVIYNGSNIPCTLQDCIIIMFLKLIGFDVVIYAPTGYRVVEQYIDSQLFNEITIGNFDFNLPNIKLKNNLVNKNKKKGFFGKIFN